jgi:hypothetical protein
MVSLAFVYHSRFWNSVCLSCWRNEEEEEEEEEEKKKKRRRARCRWKNKSTIFSTYQDLQNNRSDDTWRGELATSASGRFSLFGLAWDGIKDREKVSNLDSPPDHLHEAEVTCLLVPMITQPYLFWSSLSTHGNSPDAVSGHPSQPPCMECSLLRLHSHTAQMP